MAAWYQQNQNEQCFMAKNRCTFQPVATVATSAADTRYGEFCLRYQQELKQPQQQQDLQKLQQLHKQHQQLWLLTAVKDITHSHVPILLAQLQNRDS